MEDPKKWKIRAERDADGVTIIKVARQLIDVLKVPPHTTSITIRAVPGGLNTVGFTVEWTEE